ATGRAIMESHTEAVGMLAGRAAAGGESGEREGHLGRCIAVECEQLAHGVRNGSGLHLVVDSPPDACFMPESGLTLPLESVPHNRGHELACLGTASSQFCSNCIGLT